MELFKTISAIKSSASALLNVFYIVEFDTEDIINLKVIERQLLDMAKKYNPKWFEPIE